MIDFVPGNGVFGRGRVDGRPVIIFGDDFTVRGGSADASIREKYQMPERMAAEFRMPIIRIIEGSGGGGSVKTIETKGYANLPGGIAVVVRPASVRDQHGPRSPSSRWASARSQALAPRACRPATIR